MLLAGVFVVAGVAQHRTTGTPRSTRIDPFEDSPPLTRVSYTGLEAMSYVWVFCLASTVASFLNVVVYRMPRGLEIVRTPSHCPNCGQGIRAFDNVPVFGWLKLGGRCRSCKLPISPRYPLVEAFFGVLLVGLAAIELFSGGANLPQRPPNAYTGVVFILWSAKWDLIGIFLYHATLLGYLMTVALIHWDDERAPLSMSVGCVAVGILAPVIWPDLHPLPAVVRSLGHDYDRTSLNGAIDGVAGLAIGLAVGFIARLAVTDGPKSRRDIDGELACWAVAGVYLGWQTVAGVSLLAGLLAAISVTVHRLRFPSIRSDVPLSMLTGFACAMVLSFWRELHYVLFVKPTLLTPAIGAILLAGSAVSFAATRWHSRRTVSPVSQPG